MGTRVLRRLESPNKTLPGRSSNGKGARNGNAATVRTADPDPTWSSVSFGNAETETYEVAKGNTMHRYYDEGDRWQPKKPRKLSSVCRS